MTVGTGGKQVLYNALMATLNPGDEVIVPAPVLGQLPRHGAAGRGRPGAGAECRRRPASSFSPRRWKGDHAEDQVADPEQPNNPTGAAYTRGAMALTDVLVRHPHVRVMTDDMYEHLNYDGFEFTTPAQVEPRSTTARSRSTACPRPMHDRLADRLRRRPEGADQGHGVIQSQTPATRHRSARRRRWRL